MDIAILDQPEIAGFSARLGLMLSTLGEDAAAADAASRFVDKGLAGLREIGALHAPFPVEMGGQGLGTRAAAALELFGVLRRIGQFSPALGRVFEGHVNAVRLVVLYGTGQQARQAAADARAGHLFAIWAAELPHQKVWLDGGVLRGRKAFASAAHHVTRALVTAEAPGAGEQLVLVPLPPFETRAGTVFELHGMRSAGTAPYDFDGLDVLPSSLIGRPDDYMREPEISLGAWRTLAVQLGVLEALLQNLQADLVKRGRQADPHQLARLGNALIASETARLWVERSALLGESQEPGEHREPGEVPDAGGEAAAYYIRLARHAVETACLDVIRIAQRSVGLGAFVRPSPIERGLRDLATYLRQPALDMVLDEAAGYFITRALP